MKYNVIIITLAISLIMPKAITSQNPDVVAALQPIQNILKAILQQDAKDFNVYEKMAEYQKALKKVYEVQEAIKGMKTYLEVIKQLEALACSIRELDGMINNFSLNIPFNSSTETSASCAFNFQYKSTLTSFAMANDMIEMTLSSLQMTPSDRISTLKNGFEGLNQTFQAVQDLKKSIINFNY